MYDFRFGRKHNEKYIASALFLVSLKINYIHEVEVLSILIATLAILLFLHAVPV